MTLKKIIRYLSVLTSLLALLSLILEKTVTFLNNYGGWAFILLFMYAATLSILVFLFNQSKKKNSSFINGFMLASFGKMLVYIAIILVYSFVNPQDLIQFVLFFLVYFMFYLILEVVVLLKLNKELGF